MSNSPMNPGRHDRQFSTGMIWLYLAFVPYLATNLLFVVKYVPRYGISPFVACLLYGASVVILLRLIHAGRIDRLVRTPVVYYAVVLIVAAALLLLMQHVDPEGIRNGRYWAVHTWLERILRGEYPYSAPNLHSGFPFLFVIALPFYWLGNVGLLQIVVFMAFALILRRRSPSEAASGIALLLASPAFLYEVVVRSDLFSNTAILVCFLCVLDAAMADLNGRRRLLFGLAAGLLLSTRAIAFILWLPFLAYVIRRESKTAIPLFAYSLVMFFLTILPFWAWDARAFAASGPFSSELSLSGLPLMVIVGLAMAAFLSGLFVRSLAEMLTAAGTILFAATAVSFLICLASVGWDRAVGGDGFDISYFCFAVPPVLAAYVLGRGAVDGQTGFLQSQ